MKDWQLSDEDIYERNQCDTEQRRHLFWESGVLETCKDAARAAERKLIEKIIEWGNEQCPHHPSRKIGSQEAWGILANQVIGAEHLPYNPHLKRECSMCWQSLVEGE